MRNSLQLKFRRTFILFIGLPFFSIGVRGQHYQKEPKTELAWGIKVVTRQIQYDKNNLYITDPTSIGIQSGIRYDIPVKIATDHYIDLVGQAGFLFSKAKGFDTTFFDTNTNRYIRQHSKNPSYMPLSFGIYNMAAVSVGAEVFYWKGLGIRDILGVKFLSVGYNAKQFRLMAAGELYAQVKKIKNNGMLFSVDFFWKLIRDKE
jgi:hypothetical protein